MCRGGAPAELLCLDGIKELHIARLQLFEQLDLVLSAGRFVSAPELLRILR
jgi:hypothetical protein